MCDGDVRYGPVPPSGACASSVKTYRVLAWSREAELAFMSYHKVARMCPPIRAVHAPSMVGDGYDTLATTCMAPRHFPGT